VLYDLPFHYAIMPVVFAYCYLFNSSVLPAMWSNVFVGKRNHFVSCLWAWLRVLAL